MESISGIYCKKGSNYHLPLSFVMLQHEWKNAKALLGLLANKWIARQAFGVVNKSLQHSVLSISRKSSFLPPLNTYLFSKDRRNCLHGYFSARWKHPSTQTDANFQCICATSLLRSALSSQRAVGDQSRLIQALEEVQTMTLTVAG